jgi:hypothetical protein
MTTSQPLAQSHIQPTLFAVDFPAKTSPLQANKRASKKALGLASFTNSSESFAWYDHGMSCWKTSQRSLLTDWTPFSESWTRQGLMRNGRAYRQVLWAPVIKEIGGGLLPTPRSQEPGSTSHTHGDSVMERVCLQMGVPTKKYPAPLPTPVARDWKGRSTRNGVLPNSFVPTGGGMHLNPSFVEEMMGFPVGWTALKP